MGGVEGKEYDQILAGTPVFSPDSRHVALGVRSGGRWMVMVDGLAGNQYDGIRAPSPIFSPDSKAIAYGAQRAGKWVVVVDGMEGKEYDGFLKNSRLVFDSSSRLHTLSGLAGEFLRVEVNLVTQ